MFDEQVDLCSWLSLPKLLSYAISYSYSSFGQNFNIQLNYMNKAIEYNSLYLYQTQCHSDLYQIERKRKPI